MTAPDPSVERLQWEKYDGDCHIHWFCENWSIIASADEPGLFRLYPRPMGATALVEDLPTLDAAKALAQRLQDVLDGAESASREAPECPTSLDGKHSWCDCPGTHCKCGKSVCVYCETTEDFGAGLREGRAEVAEPGVDE